MTEDEQPLSPDMQRALVQARSNTESDATTNLLSTKDLRTINIPPFIAEHLPEGTELEGRILNVPELGGGHSSMLGLQLRIPFGQKRAAITFD